MKPTDQASVTNIAYLLRRQARHQPAQTALIFEGRAYSYDLLDRLTNRFATFLTSQGIQAGQVIAVLLESGPELLISALGAFKAGVVPNIVNAMLHPDEVLPIIVDSQAALVVTDGDRAAGLQQSLAECGRIKFLLTGAPFEIAITNAADEFDSPEIAPGSTACLLYTSGTTGRPKGVMLTHLNIVDNATQFARVHFTADDRLVVAAPLFHCWGLINGVLGIFAAGGTAVVIRRFKAESMLDLIAEVQPTQFLGVPAMLNYLTRTASQDRRSFGSLTTVHSAAAPMPCEIIHALRDSWNVRYAESYGLTEVSPVITTTAATDSRPGSCGRAMGDTELKVVDADGRTLQVGEVGELWARGTAVTAGYLNRPEETAEVFVADGWFRTGDIVRMDADGYVYIVDRIKDMINVGGEKVYPRDVEEAIFRHPAVADAVVLGKPHPELGEVPRAVIALKSGHTLTAEELMHFLRASLAKFKVPRDVEFVNVVPRSASGKALRRVLR